MNRKIRNTGVIALIGAGLMSAGAWTVRGPLRSRVLDARQTLESKTIEFESQLELARRLEEMEARLEIARETWKARPHVLPTRFTLQEFYGRLTSVADEKCHRLPFSFSALERRKEAGAESRLVQLKGAGRFKDIQRFFWELENARELCRIERVNLRWTPQGNDGAGDLTFEANVRGFGGTVGRYGDLIGTRDEPEAVAVAHNPFYPLVRESLPPNKQGLVDVEKSSLRALTPSMAFVEDQAGKLITLGVGDKVYLGYLTEVNAAANVARFTLNKGGIVETVTLGLEFGG